MGRLFLIVMSSIAELESDLIRERIKDGKHRRKLDGLKIGRQSLDINHEALVHDRLRGMQPSKGETDCAERGIQVPTPSLFGTAGTKQSDG
jgi:DNA invertase Pin-like site-specific DNA recombinase